MLGSLVLAACPNEPNDTATTTATTSTATATTTATTGPSTGDDGTTTGTQPTGGATDASTGGTTGGDSALADCQAQHAELDKQVMHDCTCAVEAGFYPDIETCVQDSLVGDAACVCPIVAADPDNAQFLACIVPAEVAYTACAAPLACDDFDGQSACADAYFAVADLCGSLTKQSLGQTAVQCEGESAFMCTGGETIPEFYACDMEPDCTDMSDEAPALCLFTCGSGETIPKDFVCDSEPDCMDMSDETPEMCLFTCGSGETVPKDFVCDGEPDCMDMSDEAMCLKHPDKRLTRSHRPGKSRRPVSR